MEKGSQGGAWATAFCILEFWGGGAGIQGSFYGCCEQPKPEIHFQKAEKFLTFRFKMPYFGACTGFLAKPDSPLPWKN